MEHRHANLTCGTTTAKCWSNRLNVRGVMYKDNRHGDLMQHFRGFLSGPNRCPGCAGHGITDRGTTCKACLGDGKLTSAVRGHLPLMEHRHANRPR